MTSSGGTRTLAQRVRDELRIVRALARERIYVAPTVEQDVVERFHQLFYNGRHFLKTWGDTYWLGVRVMKCPLDLWTYQEILHEVRPDLIVECGTSSGGSALFLACMCDILDNGRVVTIDIAEGENRPTHPRLRYLKGSSTSPDVVRAVAGMVLGRQRVLIILDSDHTKQHVASELQLYSPFVTRGSYLIVEDTNINGHPVEPDFGPGPMEAVEEFLAECAEFVVDTSREKFYLTFNPRGYLRRVK